MKTKERSTLETATARPGLGPARAALPRSAGVALEAPRRREQPSKPRRERVAYLDNLKLLLVAVIIAGHGAVAYGSLESAWPYQDVQEVQLVGPPDTALSMVVVAAALFAMGLFFLISGLVTPGSVSRKGPRAFARDRLIRLGVPLAAWTLVIWPGAIWAAHLAAGETHSFWWQFTHSDPILDTGPLWFVWVLLVYSLTYAAWRQWRPRRPTGNDRGAVSNRTAPLTERKIVALAAAVSVATVLVRLVFPIASGQIGQTKLFQWPQFVAMFGLGVVAAQCGWLDPVPDRVRRGCGFAALGGVAAFLLLAATMAATGVDPDVLTDLRFHWAPLALAAIEGPLAVGTSVWLLAVAQRRPRSSPGPVRSGDGPQRLCRVPAPGDRADRADDRAATDRGSRRGQGARCRGTRRDGLVRARLGARHPDEARQSCLTAMLADRQVAPQADQWLAAYRRPVGEMRSTRRLGVMEVDFRPMTTDFGEEQENAGMGVEGANRGEEGSLGPSDRSGGLACNRREAILGSPRAGRTPGGV